MNSAKVLIVGALALIAFTAVTAVVVVLAPYIAVAAVLVGGCWYLIQEADEPKE